MQASETFYIVGTISLIAITLLLGVLTYQLYLTLKAIQGALSQANNIADNIKNVTTGVQFGFWALASKLISGLGGRR